MEKETVHRIKLGFFVVAGAALLIVGLYFIGSNRNMFRKTFPLYVSFRNVSGLQAGNNVRYAGIDIGTVKNISILNDTLVRVEMSIELGLSGMIRKNATASVGTDGLMGNKLVNIEPGTPGSAFVSAGDELESIPSVNTEEMLRTLDFTNQNVATVSANLKSITGQINKSRGTLYTVLMDTTLAESLTNTLANIETVSHDLSLIAADLSSVMSGLKQGDGLLGKLLKDTILTAEFQESMNALQSSGRKINEAAGGLQDAVTRLNRSEGALGTLLNDTATANHLKRSMIDIENSARNFNENMEALKHSFLLRGYFKKQQNKVK